MIRQWRRERGDAQVPAEPVLAVPEAARRAAPGPDLLAGHHRRGAAHGPDRARSPSTSASSSSGSPSRRRSRSRTRPQAVVEVDEDATTFTLRGTSIAGRDGLGPRRGREQPYLRHRRRRRPLGPGGRAPPRPQPVRHQRARPRDRQVVREHGAGVHHRAVPGHRGADARRSIRPREGAQFENGAIPVRGPTSNADTVVDQGGPDRDRGRHADRRARPDAAADPSASPRPAVARPGRPSARSRSPSAPTAPSTRRSTCPRASGRSSSPRRRPRARRPPSTRNVTIVYSGVNLVVEVKGSTAWLKVWVDGKVSKVTGAAGQVYNPGKTLTFTATSRSRSGPASPARRSSRSTARTSGGCRARATPRPGSSPRPTRRSRPTGARRGATRWSSSPPGSRPAASRGGSPSPRPSRAPAGSSPTC